MLAFYIHQSVYVSRRQVVHFYWAGQLGISSLVYYISRILGRILKDPVIEPALCRLHVDYKCLTLRKQ